MPHWGSSAAAFRLTAHDVSRPLIKQIGAVGVSISASVRCSLTGYASFCRSGQFLPDIPCLTLILDPFRFGEGAVGLNLIGFGG